MLVCSQRWNTVKLLHICLTEFFWCYSSLHQNRSSVDDLSRFMTSQMPFVSSINYHCSADRDFSFPQRVEGWVYVSGSTLYGQSYLNVYQYSFNICQNKACVLLETPAPKCYIMGRQRLHALPNETYLQLFMYHGLFSFSALTLLVGRQEGHPACKNLSGEVLPWLSVWSEVQMICIWSSWCHCHPIISCSGKMVYLTGASLPRLSWKKAVRRM